MYTIDVRNVNGALDVLRVLLNDKSRWRAIAPRDNMLTYEWPEPVTTVYRQPTERVLFAEARDANPFFHLFEALWILGKQKAVRPLAYFNKQMAEYSDNGVEFHAPYGWRLQGHWMGMNQLNRSIQLLREEPDTRRVVMSIWDPTVDLGKNSKDLPCNTTLYVKVRDGKLHLTVCCRSNDALWGAYGANAVQFSMIQEYMACALGIEVGTYRQVSDSYHVYIESSVYDKIIYGHVPSNDLDPYASGEVSSLRLFNPGERIGFDMDNTALWNAPNTDYHIDWSPHVALERLSRPRSDFFKGVAKPLLTAHIAYREEHWPEAFDNVRACAALDWRKAATEWLERRKAKVDAKNRPAELEDAMEEGVDTATKEQGAAFTGTTSAETWTGEAVPSDRRWLSPDDPIPSEEDPGL